MCPIRSQLGKLERFSCDQDLVDAGFAPQLGKSSGGLRLNATFDDDDPSTPKHGWQYVATQPVCASSKAR